jgi:hypothetical protein
MDIKEIRRNQLRKLRDEVCDGSNTELARRLNKSPSYIMRLLYPASNPHRKEIGIKVMQEIQEVFNLPPGWMDNVTQTNKSWPFESVSEVKYNALNQEQKTVIEASVNAMVQAFSEDNG